MIVKVKSLVLGMVQTACYLIGDTESKQAVVIDPADDAGRIQAAAEKEGWTVQHILATHGHFDHVLAADALKAQTGAPFLIHRDDTALLEGMHIQGQLFGLNLPPAPAPDGFVADGDTLQVGALTLEVRHTPGHSPGHVSYVLHQEEIVFSGDCLFAGGIGRTDLPGGDHDRLIRSIRERLFSLDDAFTVAPGHPPTTTIEKERRHNPFL